MAIVRTRPAIVLLDMSVPTFDVSEREDGGTPQRLGGRDILRQLQERGLPVPCLVITQFDSFGDGKNSLTAEQLDRQMAAEHPDTYLGMVGYDPASSGWMDALLSKLDAFEKAGVQ
jgi:CheY-like chemotaxis protein